MWKQKIRAFTAKHKSFHFFVCPCLWDHWRSHSKGPTQQTFLVPKPPFFRRRSRTSRGTPSPIEWHPPALGLNSNADCDLICHIMDFHFDNVCTPSSLQSMAARSRAQMEVLRSQVQRRRRLEGFADLLQLCRRMDWILCHCQSLHELRRWGIWKDGQMGNCRKELVWSQMRRTPINSEQVKLTPVQRLFRL